MLLTIQFWAQLKDITGTGTLSLEVPQGTTIAELLTLLYQEYPKLADWNKSLLIAIGTEYAQRKDCVQSGDIISLMPPVQGG